MERRSFLLYVALLLKSKHLKNQLGPRVDDAFWTKGGELGPCIGKMHIKKLLKYRNAAAEILIWFNQSESVQSLPSTTLHNPARRAALA